MNNTDKRNSTFPLNPGNPGTQNEELYDLNVPGTQNNHVEDAKHSYTARNSHNLNKACPEEKSGLYDDDLSDLDDDFHTNRDLESNNYKIYEVIPEDEDDLDDIDDEEEFEEEDNQYIEDDVQEKDDNDNFKKDK